MCLDSGIKFISAALHIIVLEKLDSDDISLIVPWYERYVGSSALS